jgi:hypothetical protein
MIWDEPCPHCHVKIGDWFVEWCSIPQQEEIGKQKLAIDCPLCKKAVLIRGFSALAPPPGFQPEQPIHRDYHCAEAWAKRTGYPSLEGFLLDPTPKESGRAQPFRRGYWPNVNLPDPPIQGTNP